MSLDQTLQKFSNLFPETDRRMPVLFIGHGSPMNAIEDNEFSLAWEETGKLLPRPNAILCVSAHWETMGTQVTAMEKPRTIYDFYGFPAELYQKTYPAPGSPELAHYIEESTSFTPVQADHTWGLDHGTWSVLCRLFPQADIPVIQLSLDRTQAPAFHYALGKELGGLRKRGVLIVGSGNMVHNLRLAVFREVAFDWAVEFDETLRKLILSGDHTPVINYQQLGQPAQLSIPTNEHYLPLLYALALQQDDEEVRFFAERVTLGSISMRSLWIG